MSDEPSLTRWSFEDFKVFYDVKFGRKRLPDNQQVSGYTRNGTCSNDERASSTLPPNGICSNATMFRDGNAKESSDTAIYEHYHSSPNNNDLCDSNGAQPSRNRQVVSSLPFFSSLENRTLVESLYRDIVHESPNVKWESIKGLENAKRLLKEAVVMPLKYFTGLLSPWKGILLFGPPGTGKTMLARAVATECNTTFFNISASSVVSKWRGDSEKMVKVLFDMARHHAPSTIFVDEIDAIISQRGEATGEHESSRRLKTEFLIQMDGLMRMEGPLVFVLAATNLPWLMDSAMLRRLEKRILVALPDADARKAMLEELLCPVVGPDVAYDMLVERTHDYSGSDIRLLCKEAAMRPVRRLVSLLEARLSDARHPAELPEVGPVTPEDVDAALLNTRPSAHLHAHLYHKFNADYGS